MNCSNTLKTIADVFNLGTCFISNSVIPMLFALATAAFIWGIIVYFINPENEEKRSQGKSYMIWGLIGLFVMVSIWGLVNVLSSTVGINNKLIVPQLNSN